MSPGSVLYHYPSNEDLLLDVHATAVREYLAHRTAAVRRHADPRSALVATFAAGLPSGGDAGTDEAIRIMYEMHAVAQRSPGHRELLTGLWNEEFDLYTAVLSEGLDQRVFSARLGTATTARLLLLVEDGTALHMTSDDAMGFGDGLAILIDHAADLLACPDLAHHAP